MRSQNKWYQRYVTTTDNDTVKDMVEKNYLPKKRKIRLRSHTQKLFSRKYQVLIEEVYYHPLSKIKFLDPTSVSCFPLPCSFISTLFRKKMRRIGENKIFDTYITEDKKNLFWYILYLNIILEPWVLVNPSSHSSSFKSTDVK